jgi:hypothetical protein
MLLRTIIAFSVMKECLKIGGICSSAAISALESGIICKFPGFQGTPLLHCLLQKILFRTLFH